MSESRTTESTTVISMEGLEFVPSKDEDKVGVEVATIDWFDLIHAKVFKYPEGYEAPLHRLSGPILLTVLKGRVEFEDIDGHIEIAEAGMFRKCGETPWKSTILEESYILVIEKEDTKTIPVKE